MTKEIKTEILIQASPLKIWNILSDFNNYPNWNPFIKFIQGEIKTHSKLTVRLQPTGTKAMTFKPVVLTAVANQELSWLGHLLFKGLFDGTHKFELIDNHNGTTTFIQSEKFSGILVSFFQKKLDNQTKKGFEEMNQKLKQMAEQ